jgi:hypothetical protein
MSGVDPGVDPTQTPGEQSPLVAAGLPAWTMLLPPPLAQADMAEPSTMIAQMPIAAGTLVIMFGFSSSAATTSRLIAFPTWVSSLSSSQPGRIRLP